MTASGKKDHNQGEQQPKSIDTARKASILEAVLNTLREAYIFPDKVVEIEAHLHQRVESQAYAKIGMLEEFTRALTGDIQNVAADKHLIVFPYLPSVEETPQLDSGEEENELEEMRLINYGLLRIEILSGNVGYLKMDMFSDPQLGGPTAVAAMNFLSGVDALIVDLRDNGGGWGTMVSLLCSYFFHESVHLTTNIYRELDRNEQSWTSPYVPGPRLADTPLYILTSASTFSAAEEFAYTLKHLRRATIIGEKTRGGAHPVDYRAFPDLGIKIMVPNAWSINPVTKSNWQEVGVEPDIQVEADIARDIAYIEALKMLLRNDDRSERAARLKVALKGAEAFITPVQVDASTLMSYAGRYEDTSILFSEGKLHYQRDGRRMYTLVPLGDQLFRAGDGTIFVQFTGDPTGKISGLTATFYDGYTVHVDRT